MKVVIARVFAVCATLALLAATATAARPEEPERPYVASTQGKGARLIVGRPAGALLDAALPRVAEGGRTILLLVRPGVPEPAATDEGPPKVDCEQLARNAAPDTTSRQLIRMDLAGDGSFVTLRDDLPSDADSLAPVDLDGDGVDELLIGGRGSVSLMTATDLRPVASQPDLSLEGSLTALASMPDGKERLLIPSLRGLSLYARPSTQEAWSLLGRATIPVEASILAGDILVHAVPLQRVGGAGRAPGDPLLYAAGPREYGSQRLQTMVVHPVAASTEADPLVTESWSLLPDPEEIIESSYLMLDGKVALLAITRPGDKLSFLGEKLLRLFVLEPDRSRTGRPPLFAAQSRMNLWQLAHPVLADVNGDATADLVIGYWKGLKDSTVVLDAYLRGADGRFARSPRSTEFDVENGDRGMLEYGHDLTGDGLPDLLLRSVDTIMIHPGIASKDGKKLVSSVPSFSVAGEGMRFSDYDDNFDFSFGPRQGDEAEGARMRFRRSTSGDPRFVDLDGDGADEVVVVNTGAAGRGALHVVKFQR